VKGASLRARLRWLNLAVVAVVMVLLGIASYSHTLGEVDELSDGRLAESARTLEALLAGDAGQYFRQARETSLSIAKPSRAAVIDVNGHHFETEVGFQVFGPAGHMRMFTSNLRNMTPPDLAEKGFGNVRFDNHEWRIFTLRDVQDPSGDASHPLVIRVAERYDSRNEITHALLIEHTVPLLIGLPVLALLIGWAVRRGLRPLDELAHALQGREPGSRVHIDLADPPRELQPVIEAMNRQFDRLEDSLERERRFSADVAHELRTPLAATLVHIENAMAATSIEAKAEPLQSAHKSTGALARRIEQLLSLVRLEAGAAAQARRELDLVPIVTEVVDEMALLIANGHVELSFFTSDERIVVLGHDAALRALIRNLVENALRHIGRGGQVDISLTRTSSWVLIEVSDDGPGIPVERREAVFTRFHREAGNNNDGYGLGLSIVQRAAELHGARIELLDSSFGTGLRVRVEIPLAWDPVA
jgi:two-component system sensor histidine kinase QseC